MFDASAAAPKLGAHLAGPVAGDFPTETIDPDDGSIGGPMIADEFLF